MDSLTSVDFYCSSADNDVSVGAIDRPQTLAARPVTKVQNGYSSVLLRPSIRLLYVFLRRDSEGLKFM